MPVRPSCPYCNTYLINNDDRYRLAAYPDSYAARYEWFTCMNCNHEYYIMFVPIHGDYDENAYSIMRRRHRYLSDALQESRKKQRQELYDTTLSKEAEEKFEQLRRVYDIKIPESCIVPWLKQNQEGIKVDSEFHSFFEEFKRKERENAGSLTIKRRRRTRRSEF